MHAELHCNTASSKAVARMHGVINAEVLGPKYQSHSTCYYNGRWHCLLQIVVPAYFKVDIKCCVLIAL